MWLIDVQTFKLREFIEPPPYLILSHTWRHGEVEFRDMADLGTASKKPGWQKIEAACRLAKEQLVSYAWVDTCCIDKSSSAELTEAINSMFRWYQEAAVCATLLDDLAPPTAEALKAVPQSSTPWKTYLPSKTELQRCRWFTRGWTLQELIAPNRVRLYDSNWTFRGTKYSDGILEAICEITGIERAFLLKSKDLSLAPVAQKMSWAANRVTTRVEDMAYCLFGLFDVNMPLIYGEGQKAFLRLQEAIAQSSNDFSLFAWMPQSESRQVFRGAFATSPAEFAGCQTLRFHYDPLEYHRQSFSVSNRGVRFQVLLKTEGYHYEMTLPYQGYHGPIWLKLKPTPNGIVRLIDRYPAGQNQHGQAKFEKSRDPKYGIGQLRTGYDLRLIECDLPRHLTQPQSAQLEREMADFFQFRVTSEIKTVSYILSLPDTMPASGGLHSLFSYWDELTNTCFTRGFEKFTAMLELWVSLSSTSDLDGFRKPRLLGYLCFGLHSQLPADKTPWLALLPVIPFEDALEMEINNSHKNQLDQFNIRLALSDYPIYSKAMETLRDAAYAAVTSGFLLPTSIVAKMQSDTGEQYVSVSVSFTNSTKGAKERYVEIKVDEFKPLGKFSVADNSDEGAVSSSEKEAVSSADTPPAHSVVEPGALASNESTAS
jgi:hypothetical protein